MGDESFRVRPGGQGRAIHVAWLPMAAYLQEAQEEQKAEPRSGYRVPHGIPLALGGAAA